MEMISETNLRYRNPAAHKAYHQFLSTPVWRCKQFTNKSYLTKNSIVDVSIVDIFDNQATWKLNLVITSWPKVHTPSHMRCCRQIVPRPVSWRTGTEAHTGHTGTKHELSVMFGTICFLLLFLLVFTNIFRKRPKGEGKANLSIMETRQNVYTFLQHAFNALLHCIGKCQDESVRIGDCGGSLFVRNLRMSDDGIIEPFVDDLQTQTVVITHDGGGSWDNFLFTNSGDDPYAVPEANPRYFQNEDRYEDAINDVEIMFNRIAELRSCSGAWPSGIKNSVLEVIEGPMEKGKAEVCAGTGRSFGEWHGKFRWTQACNARLLIYGMTPKWIVQGRDLTTSVRLLMDQAETISNLRTSTGQSCRRWRWDHCLG